MKKPAKRLKAKRRQQALDTRKFHRDAEKRAEGSHGMLPNRAVRQRKQELYDKPERLENMGDPTTQ